MEEKIDLNKKVFNKGEYIKTIDSSFKQLGVKSIQEQIDEQPSLDEFFELYNTLFYDIPEVGESNSHEFLIKTSSEYINFDENSELIEALQNEIAQLREELLKAQTDAVGVDLNN